MKYVLIMLVLILSACSSAPTRILVKHCEALGDDLYSCEMIPKKEFIGKK